MVTSGCSTFSCNSFSLPSRQGGLAALKGTKSSQHIKALLRCQQKLKSFSQAACARSPALYQPSLYIPTSHPEMSLGADLVGLWQALCLLPAGRENVGAQWGAELDKSPSPAVQNCCFLPSWQVADYSCLFPAA